MYPYKFTPIYKKKIWGGRSLERLFGRSLPEGGIGESWELADLPAGETAVANGPDSARPISSLLSEKAEPIVGGSRGLADGRFPLLLKLLDANDILSLQVHPDPRAARRLGPPAQFKTECWYVIESRGGYVYKGVKPGVTAGAFRKAMESGRSEALTDMVVRYDVAPGDFHYLPAGTVHALGPGVVVAEVQTPSDTVYRVSDWGRARDIHQQEAMQCIHFQPCPAKPPGAEGDVLVRSPNFVVERKSFAAGQHKVGGGQCAAWMVLAGRGRVAAADTGHGADFCPGDTILMPARMSAAAVTADQDVRLLRITLPEA